MSINRSELIQQLANRYPQLPATDIEQAVRVILDRMTTALSQGQRIEIRGFGSFAVHYREPRVGRNPKTGQAVQLTGRYVPHFKPGKEMRFSVNDSNT